MTYRQTLLTILFLAHIFILLGETFEAQAFTAVKPNSVNGQPMQPGRVQTPGSNNTLYVQSSAVVVPGGGGTYGGRPYDAIAHFPRVPDGSYIYSGVPAGWGVIHGVSMWQCVPLGGDRGGINILLIPGPGAIQSEWGTTCTWPAGVPYPWDPVHDQAIHYIYGRWAAKRAGVPA